MLSNQKLQSAIDEIKEITQINSALYSVGGGFLAGTMDVNPKIERIVLDFVESEVERQQYDDCLYFKIIVENEVEYIFVFQCTDATAVVLGQMAVTQIRNLALSSAEQFDRNNFMQNILLGNLLAVDMFRKAKKLHIEAAARVVYVIDTVKKNNDVVMEFVKNLSDMKTGDFVTSVDQHSVVLIKDVSAVSEEELPAVLDEIAKSLVDSLHMEAMVKVRVGYGNVVDTIPGIADSFKEAKMALEVGRVFYAEYDTISYGKLGIGRLIYQLPMSLCEMYIKEVFGDEVPDILNDEEVTSTINKFFENDLNISETARQLFVHRNTLVYRLERIEKAIGLDIRKFDDAMTYRIAIMVLAHMREKQ